MDSCYPFKSIEIVDDVWFVTHRPHGLVRHEAQDGNYGIVVWECQLCQELLVSDEVQLQG